MNFKFSKKSGYTLLEVLVYVAIFIIVSVVVIDALLYSSKFLVQSRAIGEMKNSGSLAMERMVREVQTAASVNTGASTLGSHPGTLVLNSADEFGAAKVVRFDYLSTPQGIGVTDAGIDRGSLISSSTSVTNIVYRHGTTAKSSFVKIEMTVTSKKLPALPAEKFYGTAVLRGGY